MGTGVTPVPMGWYHGGMEKLFIKNRKNEKIAVLVEKSEHQRGLAFVMHGLGGFKEQEQIVMCAEAFQERSFTVVRFDTTNTLGESDGTYENATITNSYEDLEDVIQWARDQAWFQEPFVLCGYSLGGICTALYAEKYPEKVLALAPISSAISGTLMRAKEPPELVAAWDASGWKITPSVSKPGVMKKLNWHQFVNDAAYYDLLPRASALTMPVLMIVGSEDHSTPYAHQKMLYDLLPGPKELHLIQGAPHTFRDKEHLAEIKNLFLKWIDGL